MLSLISKLSTVKSRDDRLTTLDRSDTISTVSTLDSPPSTPATSSSELPDTVSTDRFCHSDDILTRKDSIVNVPSATTLADSLDVNNADTAPTTGRSWKRIILRRKAAVDPTPLPRAEYVPPPHNMHVPGPGKLSIAWPLFGENKGKDTLYIRACYVESYHDVVALWPWIKYGFASLLAIITLAGIFWALNSLWASVTSSFTTLACSTVLTCDLVNPASEFDPCPYLFALAATIFSCIIGPKVFPRWESEFTQVLTVANLITAPVIYTGYGAIVTGIKLYRFGTFVHALNARNVLSSSVRAMSTFGEYLLTLHIVSVTKDEPAAVSEGKVEVITTTTPLRTPHTNMHWSTAFVKDLDLTPVPNCYGDGLYPLLRDARDLEQATSFFELHPLRVPTALQAARHARIVTQQQVRDLKWAEKTSRREERDARKTAKADARAVMRSELAIRLAVRKDKVKTAFTKVF